MAVKTNKTDVVNNFVRYYGRKPSSAEDLKTVDYLTTKSPQEVESLLAKNSPITNGKLWGDYQKTKTSPITPIAPVTPTKTVTAEQKKQLDVVSSKPVEQQSTTDKANIKYATEKLGYVAPQKQEELPQLQSQPENSFQSSPEYQALNDDLKALADTINNALTATDEQTRLTAQEALAQAREIVDPYSKVILGFALDSIPNDFRVKKLSIEDQIINNQKSQEAISELMKTAPLEQQMELDQMRRSYENNINTIQDQAAESGLTFSSKRTDLERLIGQQNMDMMTSSKRSYANKLKTYESSQEEAKRQAELIKAAGEQTLKGIARGAEEKLGTQGYKKLGLTDLSGNTLEALGGTGNTPEYGGSIEQDRQSMILNLAQQVGQYKDPEELRKLLNQ